jgi:hypothetical protein
MESAHTGAAICSSRLQVHFTLHFSPLSTHSTFSTLSTLTLLSTLSALSAVWVCKCGSVSVGLLSVGLFFVLFFWRPKMVVFVHLSFAKISKIANFGKT